MNRYEIKRVIGESVVVINRVDCIDTIELSHNEFIWDTEFECGIVL